MLAIVVFASPTFSHAFKYYGSGPFQPVAPGTVALDVGGQLTHDTEGPVAPDYQGAVAGISRTFPVTVNSAVRSLKFEFPVLTTSVGDYLRVETSYGLSFQTTPGADMTRGGIFTGRADVNGLGQCLFQFETGNQFGLLNSTEEEMYRPTEFYVSAVEVETYPAANASQAHDLDEARGSALLLLGAGDTVFFRIPFTTDGINLWLLSWASAPADFDLFVKRGSLPSRDTYDYVSLRNGSHEALAIPPP
jgi:hypothetical protein